MKGLASSFAKRQDKRTGMKGAGIKSELIALANKASLVYKPRSCPLADTTGLPDPGVSPSSSTAKFTSSSEPLELQSPLPGMFFSKKFPSSLLLPFSSGGVILAILGGDKALLGCTSHRPARPLLAQLEGRRRAQNEQHIISGLLDGGCHVKARVLERHPTECVRRAGGGRGDSQVQGKMKSGGLPHHPFNKLPLTGA